MIQYANIKGSTKEIFLWVCCMCSRCVEPLSLIPAEYVCKMSLCLNSLQSISKANKTGFEKAANNKSGALLLDQVFSFYSDYFLCYCHKISFYLTGGFLCTDSLAKCDSEPFHRKSTNCHRDTLALRPHMAVLLKSLKSICRILWFYLFLPECRYLKPLCGRILFLSFQET